MVDLPTPVGPETAKAEGGPPQPAVWHYLAGLSPVEREAWRVADVPARPSADERNLPREFPFGWFVLGYSDELARGEVKPVRAFGQELAMWRGEDGAARVLDAYCAHYGANMAHGGKVHGNLLECPFHAWRYDGEGIVNEIPYSNSIPPQARRKDCVPSWISCEANGFIWVWYHPDRIAPLWKVVENPEVGDPAWTSYRKFEWSIYTALENLADNNVDISHFKFVHGAPTVPSYDISYEGILRSVAAKLTFNTPRGPVDGAIDSFNYGPGQGWVRFTGLSETLLVEGFTPVDHDHLRVRFAFSQPVAQAEGKGARLAAALIADICQQLDQDKVILDRYKRRDPPLVCAGDGPFGRNRLYYAQFFASTNPGGQVLA